MIKPIQIAIVDDEAIQADTMTSLISQAAEDIKQTVQITAFSSGEAFLFEVEDYPDLDMVFLDIEMKQVDGLEVAKKIRELDLEMTIVFATAFAEYAVQGYEVQAMDYLLKPIEVDKIARVLQRHLDKHPSIKETITLDTTEGVFKTVMDDIVYVEVNKRECEIHLVHQTVTVNRTLRELSDELNEDFAQTHRSYLVNVKHINRLLKADAELSNGDTVPVSRRLAKEIQTKFVEYNKRAVFYND